MFIHTYIPGKLLEILNHGMHQQNGNRFSCIRQVNLLHTN